MGSVSTGASELQEERMAFVVPPHSNLVVIPQPLSPCKKQT